MFLSEDARPPMLRCFRQAYKELCSKVVCFVKMPKAQSQREPGMPYSRSI